MNVGRSMPKPAKKAAYSGQMSQDRHRAQDLMEESIAIGQANAQHRYNNRASQHRRRAKERALSYRMERDSRQPMKAAKRFVRQ